MTAAIDNPQRFSAVVAVSPTDAAVTATEPKNLLLMAGTWERRFLDNAGELLARAGGENAEPDAVATGLARRLIAISRVEHITILFSQRSHVAALEWLDGVFGETSTGAYRDRRILFVGLQFAGWMILVIGLAPILRWLVKTPGQALRSDRRRPVLWWATGVAAPFVATLVVFVLARVTNLTGLGGMMVGGAISAWFLAAGLAWLGAGFRLQRPSVRSLLAGAMVFVVLFLAIGVAAHQVILNWILTPARLVRWPIVAATILPWTLAAGTAQAGQKTPSKLAIFVVQTVVVVAALALAGQTIPGLYFVVLLLPALPIALAAGGMTGGALDESWAYGLGNALFLGWILVAVFPMS
jgi:hypothetical protein